MSPGRKTWQEFCEAGLLRQVNRGLRPSGWRIVVEESIDDDGVGIEEIYPVRVDFRGLGRDAEADCPTAQPIVVTSAIDPDFVYRGGSGADPQAQAAADLEELGKEGARQKWDKLCPECGVAPAFPGGGLCSPCQTKGLIEAANPDHGKCDECNGPATAIDFESSRPLCDGCQP